MQLSISRFSMAVTLAAVVAPAWLHADEVTVDSREELVSALESAEAGDTIRIAAGAYEGNLYVAGLQGKEGQPITVCGLDANDPPVFRGARTGIHFSKVAYVTLRHLTVRESSANGINLDDGGNVDTPSHHVVLEDLTILETGPEGNRDGLKLSGLDDFVVRRCRIAGWGGSGIDMVGCHRGVIENCSFEGMEGFSQSNAVQMKGGSSDIRVLTNRFKNAGQRSINIGGSTGLPYFRPEVGDFEATKIEVAGNFFEGGLAPINWVTATGGQVHHNTIVRPEKWVARILQENRDERFKPSQGGVFEHNVVITDERVRVFVNVGPDTKPESFAFRDNVWYTPSGAPPDLPVEESDGVYRRHEAGALERITEEQGREGRGHLAYEARRKDASNRALDTGVDGLVAEVPEYPKEETSGETDDGAIASRESAFDKWLANDEASRVALAVPELQDPSLSEKSAKKAQAILVDAHKRMVREQRADEMAARVIELEGRVMPFWYKIFGEKPANGRSLFISMHGGGGTAKRVNDAQWNNQKRLYQPEDGIYLAPRAPTDTWNLWHQSHIDSMFDRLIENLVVFEEVDPNRVYIMGYSAGGDGVYQLAPRMADRWAAAAMMAGHPNETRPFGLRNIGFTLHVGGRDRAYRRNEVGAEWKTKLADLRETDPDGYRHEVVIHADKRHWMDLEDKVALPWMAAFTRDPIPDKVVWYQDDVTHDRFYWLALREGDAKAGQHIVVTRAGQTIDIERAEGCSRLIIRLNDAMLDLDVPVEVNAGGKTRFEGRVERDLAVIKRTLAERGDPASVFSAEILVELGD